MTARPRLGYTASTANFLMILSFVIPELIFGVAMFFVFTKLFKPIGLGTLAEVLALVTSQQRGGNGGPALNALGTIMLAMSFVAAIIGYLGYRFLTRGERGTSIDALTTIAGEG